MAVFFLGMVREKVGGREAKGKMHGLLKYESTEPCCSQKKKTTNKQCVVNSNDSSEIANPTIKLPLQK